MSLEQKKKDLIIQRIYSTLIAILLSIGMCACLLDIFGIGFQPRDAFKGGYRGGLLYLWNSFADLKGNMDYTLIDKFKFAGESGGLFITITAILLFLMSLIVLKSRRYAPFLIYVVPVVILPFVVKLGPQASSILILSSGILIGILRIKFRDNMSIWQFVSVGLIAVMVFVISDASLVKGKLYNPPVSADLNKRLEEKVKTLRYGENPLGEGKLNKKSRDKITGSAMEITMTKPETMYLRGYVGDKYNQGKWENLPAREYYHKLPLTESLKGFDFNPLTQLSRVAMLENASSKSPETSDKASASKSASNSKENSTPDKKAKPTSESKSNSELKSNSASKSNQIEIRNKDASSLYVYHPYEIKEFDSIKNVKNWGDSFLTGEKFNGAKNYKYDAIDGQTKKWTESYGKLFTMEDVSKDEAKSQLDRYFVAESYSNVDIYEKYIELSTNDVLALQPILGEPKDPKREHMGYKDAINRVQSYFRDNAVYTEKGGAEKTNAEFVKSFLEAPKGFDSQFASIATLMFRYYGIPARYVEGYVVGHDDVSKMKANKPYDLPRKNAHAWTELYVDGYGWVPVEVTEKFAEMVSQPDLEKGLENDTTLNPYDKPDPPERPNKNNQDEDYSSLQQTNYLPLWIALFILALVLAFVLYKIILICLGKLSWHRAFKQEDVNSGISAIYQYISLKNFCPTEKAVEIGNRASYSLRRCDEGERAYMLRLLRELKRESRAKMFSKFKRN